MRIAVIGCGTIGRSWAVLFAASQHEVVIYDRSEAAVAAALPSIAASLQQLQRAGRVASADEAMRRISTATTLQAAVAGAAYVQESAPEAVDIKRALFADLDRYSAPSAILASSASALQGSTFLEGLPGRARCLVAHPANPPHLLPLVELVPTPWTDQATVRACSELLRAVGQRPVLVKREIQGFVMNRLQAAVVNEAISLVEQDVMSPHDIDDVMRFSLGLRWALMGPFETMELNAPRGFRDYAEKFGQSYQELGRTMLAAPHWTSDALDRIESARRAQLPSAAVGERQLWRDERLLALRAHLGFDAATGNGGTGGP